jgi:hypothetical protein
LDTVYQFGGKYQQNNQNNLEGEFLGGVQMNHDLPISKNAAKIMVF